MQIILSEKEYADLMRAVKRLPDLEKQVKRLQEQNNALHQLYSDLLEKVGELNRLL